MKKTYNINLGGIAFIIDENAFEVLFNYLEALKRKFSNEAERKEILNDIEARMAELLLQKMSNRKEIVGLEDVQTLIAQMGQPEDIAGDEPATEGAPQQATTTTTESTPVKRRLYRDPDDAQIGGVIAGMCHYFGIDDPTWARIAAVILLVVSFGTTMLVYLLLLIIIPEANTAAEKLQMKGEPVNVNTIEKEVKDAASRFTLTMNARLSGDGFFTKVWSAVRIVGYWLLRFAAVIVAVGAFCALMGVFFGFLAFGIFGITPFNPVMVLVVDQPRILTIGAAGMLLFLGAPAIAGIYVGLRVLLGRGNRMPWIKWALLGSWLVGLCLLSYAGYKTARDFVSNATVKEQVQLTQPAKGNLFVQLADSTEAGWVELDPENYDDDSDIEDLFMNGEDIEHINSFKMGKPQLELIASENDSFYLQKLVSSQGRNRTNARQNAQLVLYSFLQTDSLLNLKHQFEIPKNGGKFRGQDMKIRLAIPEGKTVRFGGNIDEWAAIVKGDNYYDYTLFANTTWTVEKGKVKCLDCTRTTRDNDSGIKKTFDGAKDSLHAKLDKVGKEVDAIKKEIETADEDGDINQDY